MLDNLKKYHLILASNSPRRRELLSGLGIEFEVRVMPGIDESYPSMPASDVAGFIAEKKAQAYLPDLRDDELLITADTVVIVDDEILGKPADAADAHRMLRQLSGRTHQVITGVCIATNRDARFSRNSRDSRNSSDSRDSSDSSGATPSIAHYDLRFLKPLDEQLLHEIGQQFKHIVTIEDGVRNGGMGTAVMEWMNDHGYQPRFTRLGLPDTFVEHGKIAELRKIVGLDNESIKKALLS